MTPRYEWTPASEPPDTDRLVVTWLRKPYSGVLWVANFYANGRWNVFRGSVTHWCDVEPPDGAALEANK